MCFSTHNHTGMCPDSQSASQGMCFQWYTPTSPHTEAAAQGMYIQWYTPTSPHTQTTRLDFSGTHPHHHTQRQHKECVLTQARAIKIGMGWLLQHIHIQHTLCQATYNKEFSSTRHTHPVPAAETRNEVLLQILPDTLPGQKAKANHTPAHPQQTPFFGFFFFFAPLAPNQQHPLAPLASNRDGCETSGVAAAAVPMKAHDCCAGEQWETTPPARNCQPSQSCPCTFTQPSNPGHSLPPLNTQATQKPHLAAYSLAELTDNPTQLLQSKTRDPEPCKTSQVPLVSDNSGSFPSPFCSPSSHQPSTTTSQRPSVSPDCTDNHQHTAMAAATQRNASLGR
jgi:hypothetical protein